VNEIPETPSYDLGQRIVYLRNLKEISQSELAIAINLNRSVLNRIENGTRPVRDIELVSLADYFNVTTDYLLGRKVKDNLNVAAHIDIEGFNPKQRKDIKEYVEFKKSQYRKEHESKKE